MDEQTRLGGGKWSTNPNAPPMAGDPISRGIVKTPRRLVAIEEIRADREYDPDQEGSVDDLIASKDAIEDQLIARIDCDGN